MAACGAKRKLAPEIDRFPFWPTAAVPVDENKWLDLPHNCPSSGPPRRLRSRQTVSRRWPNVKIGPTRERRAGKFGYYAHNKLLRFARGYQSGENPIHD